MQIDVYNLSGPLCRISADEGWSVSQLKSAVFEATGIFASLQRLLHGQNELYDAQLISALLPGESERSEGCAVEICLLRRHDIAEWLEKIQKSRNLIDELQFAPEHVRSDKDIVLCAVKRDGRALEFAGSLLKADPEVVLAAGEQNGSSFAFAHQDLRRDYQFVMRLVQRNGCTLCSASDDLRADMNIVWAAVMENEYALKYAARQLREDKTFLMPLLRKNPHAIGLVHHKLKHDPDLQSIVCQAA